MKNGDVLAELRAWRDEFARSHGYDIHLMAAALREQYITSGRELVRGEPRRPMARMPNKTLQPTGAAISASPGSTSPEAAPGG